MIRLMVSSSVSPSIARTHRGVGRQAELVEDLVQLMAVGGQPLVQLVPDPAGGHYGPD
jgi:hypothetical protein